MFLVILDFCFYGEVHIRGNDDLQLRLPNFKSHLKQELAGWFDLSALCCV